jgi:hypothetical protein
MGKTNQLPPFCMIRRKPSYGKFKIWMESIGMAVSRRSLAVSRSWAIHPLFC